MTFVAGVLAATALVVHAHGQHRLRTRRRLMHARMDELAHAERMSIIRDRRPAGPGGDC